jgi:hypothetical protein
LQIDACLVDEQAVTWRFSDEGVQAARTLDWRIIFLMILYWSQPKGNFRNSTPDVENHEQSKICVNSFLALWFDKQPTKPCRPRDFSWPVLN